MVIHKFLIDSTIVESIKRNNISILLNRVLVEISDLSKLTDIINDYAPSLPYTDNETSLQVTFRLSDKNTKYISIIHANNELTLQQTFEGLLQAIIYSPDLVEIRWQNRKLFK